MATAKRQRPKMTLTGSSDPPQQVAVQGPEISGPSQAPSKPGASETKQQQASRTGKRAVTFYVSPDAFRQLRVLAAQTDKTIQQIMVEALDWVFQQHDMHRIAQE